MPNIKTESITIEGKKSLFTIYKTKKGFTLEMECFTEFKEQYIAFDVKKEDIQKLNLFINKRGGN